MFAVNRAKALKRSVHGPAVSVLRSAIQMMSTKTAKQTFYGDACKMTAPTLFAKTVPANMCHKRNEYI